jgi:hypothetical protein
MGTPRAVRMGEDLDRLRDRDAATLRAGGRFLEHLLVSWGSIVSSKGSLSSHESGVEGKSLVRLYFMTLEK